ncbi:MAG: ATP-binding protein [gamma proteobacterium symbiont of Bathyaustriella thionipta]|nr:ATP-binding protein [gamma proteobacterium symbiont of Bathyaustriella thionipta]
MNEETSNFGKSKTALNGKFDQLLVKLQSRFNDKRYDFLLKPKIRTDSESLPKLMRDLVGLGEPKAQITVIDLSAVPWDVKPTVTAQIARLSFEFNYWNPRFREFPLFLLCEEAHAYIPRANDPKFAGTKRAMERIAKEGRKYGVGLGIVSQRPAELSETVLAQCANYICMRISNPDDQEYIRKLVPDAARGILDSITSLARGEAIVMGEAVPMPVRFRVDRPNPPPNAADIDYAGQWTEGPQDISVEHMVERCRNQQR